MGLEWSDESHFKKEMKKWDTPKRLGGYNRDGHEEYPKMLYKCQRNPISNRYEVAIYQDVISLDKTVVLLSAEQFNASCQQTVKNEHEHDMARRDGWRDTQGEAVAYYQSLQDEISLAAAERAAADAKMGEKAQAEAAAVDASTSQHVPEIPRQKRKYTRRTPVQAI